MVTVPLFVFCIINISRSMDHFLKHTHLLPYFHLKKTIKHSTPNAVLAILSLFEPAVSNSIYCWNHSNKFFFPYFISPPLPLPSTQSSFLIARYIDNVPQFILLLSWKSCPVSAQASLRAAHLVGSLWSAVCFSYVQLTVLQPHWTPSCFSITLTMFWPQDNYNGRFLCL